MPDDPAPPTPPGTTTPTFFQRTSTKMAIVATVVAVNTLFLRPFLILRFGEAGAAVVEGVEMAWLTALGISQVDAKSLRRK